MGLLGCVCYVLCYTTSPQRLVPGQGAELTFQVGLEQVSLIPSQTPPSSTFH